MDRTLLLERLTTWLEADPRIQALWLGGSLGRYAGDAYSDIDLYVAVAEADFAPFYAQVPSLVAERLPLLHVTEFAFRRDSPTERVWFLYVEGAPIFWRIDFHVHTTASAQGADPDHRRELINREFKVVKDPMHLLAALPPMDAPELAVYQAHVAERVNYFAMVFALMAGCVARGRFWETVGYLVSMQERMLYLAAVVADPPSVGDGYPRRQKQVAAPALVARLERLRFGADVQSQAAAALELIGVFEAAATQGGAPYPAKFMLEVVRVYTQLATGGLSG